MFILAFSIYQNILKILLFVTVHKNFVPDGEVIHFIWRSNGAMTNKYSRYYDQNLLSLVDLFV